MSSSQGRRHVTATLLWFALLAVAAVALDDGGVGALAALVDRRAGPEEHGGAAAGPAILTGAAAPARAEPVEPPPLPPARPAGAPPPPFTGHPVEDPCVRGPDDACEARALDGFYAALLAVERRDAGAIARVAHFGDSIVADDGISGRLRDRFQAQFGDAGAGFVYFARPSRFYVRRGVEHRHSDGWKVRSVVFDQASDGLYGLGGVTFEALGRGQEARFGTATKGAFGGAVGRFDVYYLEQPGGGTLELLVDGAPAGTVSTAGEARRPAYHRVEVPDGPHTLVARIGAGRVRAFGVVMEREAPGVVVDNLGIISGSARALAAIPAPHLAEQVAHRRPDLIVVMYGANEAEYLGTGARALAAYEETFARMLEQARAGRPEAGCLVIAPLDAAESRDGRLVGREALPGLVEAQRRAARARGCAFWDTFAWMGGRGAAVKWRKQGLLEPDYTHPTARGAARVADAVFDALVAGFEAYKAREEAR